MIALAVRGLTGYLFQLLPCAFFCLYPFYDDFREHKNKLFTAIGVTFSVMAFFFTRCYVLYITSDTGSYYNLELTLIFLLSVILLLILYLTMIRAEAAHKFFILTLILNYGFLMTEIISSVSSFLSEDYMYNTPVLILHLVFNAILFHPMLTILRNARNAFKSKISTEVWWSATMVPFIFFLGLLLFYEIPLTANVSYHHVLVLFGRAMEILMFFVCYVILRIINTVQHLTIERISLEKTVENYKAAASAAEQDREARHEFHHHIAALSILLQNQDYARAKAYLDKISQNIVQNPVHFYTHHLLLNSMLCEYEKHALDMNIHVQYTISVPNPFSMDDLDLCHFLSNLLDNALEANGHLPPKNRRLTLVIRQNGNFLYFLCKNPCDLSLLHATRNGFSTTKENARTHGYGITIMKRIAEKYNGVFQTDISNSTFTATANLCTPPEHGRNVDRIQQMQ